MRTTGCQLRATPIDLSTSPDFPRVFPTDANQFLAELVNASSRAESCCCCIVILYLDTRIQLR
jgi:hypothetical protein